MLHQLVKALMICATVSEGTSLSSNECIQLSAVKLSPASSSVADTSVIGLTNTSAAGMRRPSFSGSTTNPGAYIGLNLPSNSSGTLTNQTGFYGIGVNLGTATTAAASGIVVVVQTSDGYFHVGKFNNVVASNGLISLAATQFNPPIDTNSSLVKAAFLLSPQSAQNPAILAALRSSTANSSTATNTNTNTTTGGQTNLASQNLTNTSSTTVGLTSLASQNQTNTSSTTVGLTSLASQNQTNTSSTNGGFTTMANSSSGGASNISPFSSADSSSSAVHVSSIGTGTSGAFSPAVGTFSPNSGGSFSPDSAAGATSASFLSPFTFSNNPTSNFCFSPVADTTFNFASAVRQSAH